MKKFYGINLLFILLICGSNLYAQATAQDFQTLKREGIALYKKGEYRDAMNSLKRLGDFREAKTDAEFWNYLGLAYLERDDAKNALKALEKAAKIAPQNATYRANLAFVYLTERKIDKAQSEVEKAIGIDPQNANAYYISGTANLWERKHELALRDAEKAISVNGKFSPAYVLKANVYIYEFGKGATEKTPLADNLQWLTKAQETMEICEKLCARDANYKDAEAKFDAIKAFHKFFKKKADFESGVKNAAAADTSNRTPLKIVAKPHASYTDRARRNGVSGTISMAVVFTADRKIGQVMVLKGLGYGLDEEAVKAAANIVFEPETENGKPITVVKTLQYSFTIY